MTRPTLVLLLLLAACAPAPVSQTSPSPPTDLSSQIRPGSKGQRLELVEGEMLVPAGTSAYTIQSAQQPGQASPAEMAFGLLIAPAYAQEVDEAAAPIEQSQIAGLKASIDGVEVKFEVLSSVSQSDGSLLVSYRLRDVPASDENVVIAFSSASGAFVIKGVLPKLQPGMRKLSQRFDIETTALAEALELNGERVRDLSGEELRRLAKSDVVQSIRDKVYEHLLKSPKGKRFDETVGAAVRALLPGSSLRIYLEQRSQCRKLRCSKPPELPPLAERPVASALLSLAGDRLRLRASLLSQSRPPTAEERAQLLRLGPIARRLACLQKKISPCP